MTNWLNAGEMAAWQAFLNASHLLERRVEEQLRADAGLTHGQYEVLARLSATADRRLRMSELARDVIVSKSALTYQVSRLEERGLVRRTNCPSDDRGVFAELTDEGMRCLEHLAPGHVAVVRANLIDHLTPDDLTALTRIMSKAEASMRST
ncbi:MarR family transcriptional regulator [Streptosporangium soli]|nr:MarR family transcriptional regulator [Streptosporangium sp. KLBMP 9127]